MGTVALDYAALSSLGNTASAVLIALVRCEWRGISCATNSVSSLSSPLPSKEAQALYEYHEQVVEQMSEQEAAAIFPLRDTGL